MLQVWSEWFLFSDAYANGLQATFFRSGNSGVTTFHFICGDAPEIVNALAMHKVAAVEELMNLFLADLEKCCRHNGLSLFDGREMMVARLLSLEDAEKQRRNELDDLKSAIQVLEDIQVIGKR